MKTKSEYAEYIREQQRQGQTPEQIAANLNSRETLGTWTPAKVTELAKPQVQGRRR